MSTELLTKITTLLSQAAAAHHVYEEGELKGVYDEQWTHWYANWLIEHDLNTILATTFEKQRLAALLHELNEAHQQSDRQLSWAEFTAERLLDEAGKSSL